jgi:hypothetical protein
MPKPVPRNITVVLMGYSALLTLTQQGTAMSPEAKAIKESALKLTKLTEESQSLFGAKAATILELQQMAMEYSDKDWDGNDELPISYKSLHNAVAFIRALPDGVPVPEVAPEPDGAISLDWIRSRHRIFSISVGNSDRLAFAWLDGTDKGHGVARFDGFTIPPRVLELIESVENDISSLWVA